jgi:prepilin signal peptidase PulO-like enzyme (type II secretory pathway)
MNIFAAIFAALVGLIAGGIVNMLADDLPFTLFVRLPHYPDSPSVLPTSEDHAPTENATTEADQTEPPLADLDEPQHVFDGVPRPPIAWLGILAFLTGKRVGVDGRALSWRHPITEILMTLLFAYIALMPDKLPLTRLFYMGCVAILALITVIDLEHRLILYAVIIPGVIFSLVGTALVHDDISHQIWYQDYLYGGLFGFILFFLLFLGGILFNVVAASGRGEPIDEVAFGFGDVMLAALSGFMLGWQALIFAVFIAIFTGAFVAIAFLLIGVFTRKYDMFTALPYGQNIVFGTLVMLLWRDVIVQFFQGGR